MKNFVATLLLICFGLLMPVAALPVRVCLLDLEERQPECCQKCGVKHDNCCKDLDQIPDSVVPGGPMAPLMFVPFELPVWEIAAVGEVIVESSPREISPPIRGPDSPAAFRAVLGIWSI